MAFQKGQSGNPNGRAPGTRDRLTRAFIHDLAEDWDRNGKKAIGECRRDDPAKYLTIVASLVPREMTLDVGGGFIKLLEAIERNSGPILDLSPLANSVAEQPEQPGTVRPGRTGRDAGAVAIESPAPDRD